MEDGQLMADLQWYGWYKVVYSVRMVYEKALKYENCQQWGEGQTYGIVGMTM